MLESINYREPHVLINLYGMLDWYCHIRYHASIACIGALPFSSFLNSQVLQEETIVRNDYLAYLASKLNDII